MMHYLVTGGAGFIGSHLVEALIEQQCAVTVFDDFSTGKEENLNPFQGKITLERGTITDLEKLKKAMKGVDVVFHHAAIPSVTQSVADPLYTHDVNLTGTLNVLIAARDQGVKRVVYASSSAVYGDPGGEANKETTPTDPLSPYAAQKLAGELYAGLFKKLYGTETVGLRYFNVYGPRQDPSSQYSGVISKFIEKVKSDEVPVIFGDGSQTRDFVYVKDVVQANLLAAHTPAPRHAVYNVGTGKSISLIELVQTLSRISKSSRSPIFEPPRAGDILHSACDNRRVHEEWGFEPKFTLEEGLNAILNY